MARGKTAIVDAAAEPSESAVGDQQDLTRLPHDDFPRWQYSGPDRRIYASVPVTVDPGDIVPCPVIPAGDGFWTETAEPYNRLPDNFAGGVTGG